MRHFSFPHESGRHPFIIAGGVGTYLLRRGKGVADSGPSWYADKRARYDKEGKVIGYEDR